MLPPYDFFWPPRTQNEPRMGGTANRHGRYPEHLRNHSWLYIDMLPPDDFFLTSENTKWTQHGRYGEQVWALSGAPESPFLVIYRYIHIYRRRKQYCNPLTKIGQCLSCPRPNAWLNGGHQNWATKSSKNIENQRKLRKIRKSKVGGNFGRNSKWGEIRRKKCESGWGCAIFSAYRIYV